MRAGTLLDYGCGPKARLLHQLQHEMHHAVAPHAMLVGADPCLGGAAAPAVPEHACLLQQAAPSASQQQQQQPKQEQPTSILLSSECTWAAAGAGGQVVGGYDAVLCSLVLCTVADRRQYLEVLDNLATAVKPGAFCQAPDMS